MSMLARRARGSDLSSWFEERMRSFPMFRPFGLPWDWLGEDIIRVDEYHDGDTLVIRAELPGIDPDRDVELTVSEGMLRINAERRLEEESKDKGYVRHELSYGHFSRTLPLPEGVTESDIRATYQNGILEIRVPVPEATTGQKSVKIPISKGG